MQYSPVRHSASVAHGSGESHNAPGEKYLTQMQGPLPPFEGPRTHRSPDVWQSAVSPQRTGHVSVFVVEDVDVDVDEDEGEVLLAVAPLHATDRVKLDARGQVESGVHA